MGAEFKEVAFVPDQGHVEQLGGFILLSEEHLALAELQEAEVLMELEVEVLLAVFGPVHENGVIH